MCTLHSVQESYVCDVQQPASKQHGTITGGLVRLCFGGQIGYEQRLPQVADNVKLISMPNAAKVDKHCWTKSSLAALHTEGCSA